MIKAKIFLFLLLTIGSCVNGKNIGEVEKMKGEEVTAGITANDPGKMEAEILSLVNAHRKKKKLPMLVWNDAMAKAALQHSQNMAKGKSAFGHGGFQDRVKQISATEGTLMGWAENVAQGQLSAKEVVDGWLKSPGHRKNIEGKFNLMGVGIAKNKRGELYFTQIFGIKSGG